MDASIEALIRLIKAMPSAEASDLHLVPGYRPMYRIHGELTRTAEAEVGNGAVVRLLEAIAPPEIPAKLAQDTDLDFAIQIADGAGSFGRFRINVFASRGDFGACLRAVPERIPGLAELGFPVELADRIVALNSGLVLVTGATGSGKTTSIAAMLQIMNARGGCRIITVEEPVEYLYPRSEAGLVTQREVGADVPSFYDGLRYGLRQDPDVMLVGEIRDRQTAQLAVSGAETGHLIFATLHATDAKGAVTRLVDLFPPEQHDDIRTQLSMSLRYVIVQHLLPAEGGGRRVLALEVMMANFAVRSAVRQGKMENLESAMQSGRKDGMFTLDTDLKRLFLEGRISLETARSLAKDPAEIGAAR